QNRLPLVENEIERRVLGDAFESDMGNRLTLERAGALYLACRIVQPGTVGVTGNIFGAGRSQLVVVELCRQQTLAGNSESNTGNVNTDPAPAPLLGDIGGCAAAKRGIEDKIAGVGCKA